MTFRQYFAGGMLCLAVNAQAVELELFTTRDWPVTGQLPPGTTVYVLDDPDRLEAQLSRGLASDRQAAVAQARQALPGAWQAVGRDLTRAYQGLHKAKTYHLTQVPALVVDGKPVAVGAEHVQAALKQYLTVGAPP